MGVHFKFLLNNKLYLNNKHLHTWWGFPNGSAGKESACSAGTTGDAGLVPGLGRSPEGRNGNPLQHSCLGNPMDLSTWWATGHGVARSWM